MILSLRTCKSNHHRTHFKYFTVLCVSYSSVKMGVGQGGNPLVFISQLKIFSVSYFCMWQAKTNKQKKSLAENAIPKLHNFWPTFNSNIQNWLAGLAAFPSNPGSEVGFYSLIEIKDKGRIQVNMGPEEWLKLSSQTRDGLCPLVREEDPQKETTA